jgi:hypothetical protein
MRVQTGEALAPLVRFELLGPEASKRGAASSAGFGG